MKYCSECGKPVVSRVPEGDSLPRFVCDHCGIIHYRNPLMVVGCVPEFMGKILLCRRSIEPRKGFWTLPAGFMELGETLPEAAMRETWEEARAKVTLGALFALVDVVHAGQVHAFFAAQLPVPEFAAGDETLETRLFDAQEIPWEQLAFPSVRLALERYLENRQTGSSALFLATAPRLSMA